MKTSLTEIPMCPRERFALYKSLSRLVLCYKKDRATLLHLNYLVTCYPLRIILSQNYLLLIISVFAENTLLKTACHFLLILVGFDTFTYRKDYDRSPILVGHYFYTVIIKDKRDIFLQEISERPRNFREVFNKPPIETSITKKTSYTFDVLRTRHLFNSIYFSFINFNTSFRNFMPKTIPSLTIKWHFSQFKTRLVSSHLCKTQSRLLKQSSKEVLKTKKPSMKTSTFFSQKTENIAIIHFER